MAIIEATLLRNFVESSLKLKTILDNGEQTTVTQFSPNDEGLVNILDTFGAGRIEVIERVTKDVYFCQFHSDIFGMSEFTIACLNFDWLDYLAELKKESETIPF